MNPQTALQKMLSAPPESLAWIDVRSEGEYAFAHLPHFKSAPILSNRERHEIGVCYKQNGREAAIKLGHEFFALSKDSRIQTWQQLAQGRQTIVTCWRGGLRSQFASQFMRDQGIDAVAVKGGYKAIRAELTAAWKSLPPLVVLSGATGSGKTLVIQDLIQWSVDLEGIANHRGSAFGRSFQRPQPTQSQFENDLGFSILNRSRGFLVEDESVRIGDVSIPLELKHSMIASPHLVLESDRADRANRIYDQYVTEPLEQGVLAETLKHSYLSALTRIQARLGHQRKSEIEKSLLIAFETQLKSAHLVWIDSLLEHYYDRVYQQAFDKTDRKVVFKGNAQEIKTWIQNRFA